MPVVLLKRGLGEPGTLADNEPALDLTPGEPKLWAGIGGVPTVLADPALLGLVVARVMNLEARVADTELRLNNLEPRMANLEARVAVLEGGVWGVGA